MDIFRVQNQRGVLSTYADRDAANVAAIGVALIEIDSAARDGAPINEVARDVLRDAARALDRNDWLAIQSAYRLVNIALWVVTGDRVSVVHGALNECGPSGSSLGKYQDRIAELIEGSA